jgi:hypothetical protein
MDARLTEHPEAIAFMGVPDETVERMFERPEVKRLRERYGDELVRERLRVVLTQALAKGATADDDA